MSSIYTHTLSILFWEKVLQEYINVAGHSLVYFSCVATFTTHLNACILPLLCCMHRTSFVTQIQLYIIAKPEHCVANCDALPGKLCPDVDNPSCSVNCLQFLPIDTAHTSPCTCTPFNFVAFHQGRSPTLHRYIRGVLTNPNCEYEANFVAIRSLGLWAHASLPVNVPLTPFDFTKVPMKPNEGIG